MSMSVNLDYDVNRESVSMSEWQMVLMELHSNSIGVKGNDMFTITYGFVGNVSWINAKYIFRTDAINTPLYSFGIRISDAYISYHVFHHMPSAAGGV